jgi:hypothetical protein
MRKAKKSNGGTACGPCGALSDIISLDKKRPLEKAQGSVCFLIGSLHGPRKRALTRSLLRGWRANQKIDRIPIGEDASIISDCIVQTHA